MTVYAECLACRTPLIVVGDPPVARRQCACPWPPRADGAGSQLPTKRDDKKAGVVELVRAWTA